MPADQGAERMDLWLATADGTRISTPVQLGVESAPGMKLPAFLLAGLMIVGIAIAARMPWVRRNGRKKKNRLLDLSSRPVNR